jgi:hypothetical protein
MTVRRVGIHRQVVATLVLFIIPRSSVGDERSYWRSSERGPNYRAPFEFMLSSLSSADDRHHRCYPRVTRVGRVARRHVHHDNVRRVA